MVIRVKYENGVFKPLNNIDLKNGTMGEVHVPSSAEITPERKQRSVRDFAFAGMWADREEMADSVEYINNLRNNLRAQPERE